MDIIKNEIKKVFNLTNLIVVGIVSLIIWILFISFGIEYFPNGSSETESYNNSVYMLENYGISMDENEFKEFKNMREEKVKEAEEYLSSKEECIKVGLSTYEDFIKIYKSEVIDANPDNEKGQQALHNKVMFDDNVEVFWELQAIDYDIDRFENKEFWISNSDEYKNISGNKLELYENRHNEMVQSENATSPLNWVIMRNYNSLIGWMNLLIIITVAIIVSPIFIIDNKNKVNYLQYSSKEGRKSFNKKIIAGIISSIAIVTAQLAIFFIIYESNNTYMFWNCSINSAVSDVSSWFDMTFGQYIMITVVLTYIVGIVVGIIAMGISSKVKTYISLIGIQILILFGLWGLLKSIGINNVTSTFYPKYTIHFIYLTLILVSVFIITKIIRKEKKLDI